jgi:hypothetical protein
MVGGNIGFSISDIRAPDDQAALLGGDSETIRGLGNSANKDRPEAVKYTRHALSWQGFGSSRAAGGAALSQNLNTNRDPIPVRIDRFMLPAATLTIRLGRPPPILASVALRPWEASGYNSRRSLGGEGDCARPAIRLDLQRSPGAGRCAPGLMNSRQPGLSCALFLCRQALTRSTFGISAPHKRNASPVHACRPSGV